MPGEPVTHDDGLTPTPHLPGNRWLERIDDVFLLGVVALMIPVALVVLSAPIALVAWLAGLVAR